MMLALRVAVDGATEARRVCLWGSEKEVISVTYVSPEGFRGLHSRITNASALE